MGYNWNSRCLQRVSWNKTICQSLTQTVAIHNGFEKLAVFPLDLPANTFISARRPDYVSHYAGRVTPLVSTT